jgi:protein O-GlcNAc transferase
MATKKRNEGPNAAARMAEANARFEHAERLRNYGQTELAIEAYRGALALQPRFVSAHNNLAALLRQRGEARLALAHYRAAIDAEPGIAALHFNLGKTLESLGDTREAIACLRRALKLDAGLTAARHDLALALMKTGEIDAACTELQRVVADHPDHALAEANLATLLRARGETRAAFAASQRATALDPNLYLGWSNQLCLLPYLSDLLDEDVIRATLAGFDRRFGQAHGTAAEVQPGLAEGRPLRIGYLSADFREHAVNQFFEPVARSHNAARCSVYCYDLNQRPDAVTARLRTLVPHWRHCAAMSDAALVDCIQRDQLDVLVDLMGHTADNRLPLYAQRLAPLQLMWMGWPGTTGLSSFDYVVTDPQLDASKPTALHGPEARLQLPRSWVCFEADDHAPAITPLPAALAGHVTFGSFNGIYKLNETMLGIWSGILSNLPGSRLLIAGVPAGVASQRLLSEFSQHGVSPDRLSLRPPLGIKSFFDLYAEVDIALDTSPFNGLTTTLNSLWMGVPVLSLAGTTHASRMGASVLANLGLPEWIVESPAAYQRAAFALAQDIEALQVLRQELRERLRSSPLMDHAGFTREWEASLYKLAPTSLPAGQ